MLPGQADGRRCCCAAARKCRDRVRETGDALDDVAEETEPFESESDLADLLSTSKLESTEARNVGVGGENATKEVGHNDAGERSGLAGAA